MVCIKHADLKTKYVPFIPFVDFQIYGTTDDRKQLRETQENTQRKVKYLEFHLKWKILINYSENWQDYYKGSNHHYRIKLWGCVKSQCFAKQYNPNNV